MRMVNEVSARVPVKFIHPWSAYNPGEVAGFDPAQSRRLIEAKIARSYSELKVKFLKEHQLVDRIYEPGDVLSIDAEVVDALKERSIVELFAAKPGEAPVKK